MIKKKQEKSLRKKLNKISKIKSIEMKTKVNHRKFHIQKRNGKNIKFC